MSEAKESIFETRPISPDSANLRVGKPQDRFKGAHSEEAPFFPLGTKWSQLETPKATARCMFVYPGITSPGWNSCQPGQTSNEAVYMSHGMAYVSSALKARGHLVWLLDMRTCRGWKDFENKVRASQYDVAYLGFLSHDMFSGTAALRILKEAHPDRPVVVGGLHVSCCELKNYPPQPGQKYYLPDMWLGNDKDMHPLLRQFLDWKGETIYDPKKFPQADCVIWNEAEIAASLYAERFVAGEAVPPFINARTIPDLNETPHCDRDLFNTELEAAAPLLDFLPPPFFTITFGRGCPFACLAGDTPINTSHGKLPIKSLVGRSDIGVFTRDKQTGSAVVVTPEAIFKTGEGKKLVRVRFTDGSFIDCTPDHRFMAFKWGNQFAGEREWEVEAANLVSGTRVRAVREELSGPSSSQYVSVCWGRRSRAKKHRLVLGWKIGRPLQEKEIGHHLDGDRLNNHPSNLALCRDAKDHLKHHLEVSDRMKKHNPAEGGLSPEWRARISAATKGVPKSVTARQRMCLAAIRRERRRRVGVNHVVASVTPLDGGHDTYCMSIPGYDWFYANDVLVHNCSFCNIATQLSSAKVRLIDPDYFMDELQRLHDRFGKIGSLMIHDDILLYPKWIAEWCEKIKAWFGYIPFWCQMRADFICKNPDLMRTMAEAGLAWVSVGLESGSERLLDFMAKQTTVAQNIESCRILRELGVNVFGNWMLGLPTETHADCDATAAMMAEIAKGGLRHSASVYCNYPGTSLETYLAMTDQLLPSWYARSHFPWQRAIKGVDYDYAYKVQREVMSKYPNKATQPKLWRP